MHFISLSKLKCIIQVKDNTRLDVALGKSKNTYL